MKSTSNSDIQAWLGRHGTEANRLPPESVLARLIAGPARADGVAAANAASEPVVPSPGSGKPLRVLMLLCQKVGETGSGIVVKEMIDGAAGAGVEYDLICGGYADDDPSRLFSRQPRHLNVMRFGSTRAGDIPFLIAGMSNAMPYPSIAFKDLTVAEVSTYLEAWHRRIRHAVREYEPQVIHVHHLWLLAALAAMEAAETSPRTPVVATVHGTDLFRADDAPHLAALVARWVHRISRALVLTDDAVAAVRSRYDIDPTRLAVTGNGFNRRLFFPASNDVAGARSAASAVAVDTANTTSAADVPSGLRHVKGRKVVLCVGKYDRRKGIEWLIRAFAQLPAGQRDEAVLVVGGSGPDSERERYLSIACELGISDRVILLGPVPYERVATLMNQAHVFALPAFHEPFGLVLLEALACGCRVVTTDQGGPPGFIDQRLRQRGDAVLIPGLPDLEPSPESAQAFVHRLAAAVSDQLSRTLDHGDRERIAAAVQGLTWDAYSRRLSAIYHELWEERRALHLSDLTDQLSAWHARLAAGAGASSECNNVPADLPIRLIGPGRFEFLPAASLAIQAIVPAASDVHAACEGVARDLQATFPNVSAHTYWQPAGTYHLNVAILQRLTSDVRRAAEHEQIVGNARPLLDWLAAQPEYPIRFRGLLVTTTGTILTVGEPLCGTALRIREGFRRRSFTDQQPVFHITLGRVLTVLTADDWSRFLTTFYGRFAARGVGTLQVRDAVLVSEVKGFLHAPSHYTVMRAFCFGEA